MQYKIFPPENYKRPLPFPFKSINNRLLIMNALSCSPYPIENLSDCEDTQVPLTLSTRFQCFRRQRAGTAMRF